MRLVYQRITITLEQLQQGCDAYRENEPRDSIYRVALFLLQNPDWWGDPRRVADALAVLELTWNANFYRYSGGYLAAEPLEQFLRDNWPLIEDFHHRNIADFRESDTESVRHLFDAALEALRIETTKTKEVRRSSVAAAKALHLLAPGFLPIWDNEISKNYNCSYSTNPGVAYCNFFREIQRIALALAGAPAISGKTLVKQIDEYNFAHFTKGWI